MFMNISQVIIFVHFYMNCNSETTTFFQRCKSWQLPHKNKKNKMPERIYMEITVINLILVPYVQELLSSTAV